MWAMRPVRLAMEKCTITKNNHLKGIIGKNAFVYYAPTSQKHIL